MQNPDEPIRRTVNTKRLSSVTIYGGINARTSTFVHMLWKGTNRAGWKAFLRKLKQHTDEQYIRGPFNIVIDNHSAHRSKAMIPDYDGFKVLFLPAYSSFLSSIETIWSLLKDKLAKNTARISREITQAEYEAEIERVCVQLNHEQDISKMMLAARDELLQALERRE